MLAALRVAALGDRVGPGAVRNGLRRLGIDASGRDVETVFRIRRRQYNYIGLLYSIYIIVHTRASGRVV